MQMSIDKNLNIILISNKKIIKKITQADLHNSITQSVVERCRLTSSHLPLDTLSLWLLQLFMLCWLYSLSKYSQST